MTPPLTSALFPGHVTHARLKPKTHKLAYRIYSLLLDLDGGGVIQRTPIHADFHASAPITVTTGRPQSRRCRPGCGAPQGCARVARDPGPSAPRWWR